MGLFTLESYESHARDSIRQRREGESSCTVDTKFCKVIVGTRRRYISQRMS